MTDRIVYSDDGAWDYSCLPVEGKDFEEEYLNLNKVNDVTVVGNIKKWIQELKNLCI